MSEYYNPKRKRNVYDPASSEPFKLSRSKLDLFLNCPRCFYLDRRLGVDRPPGFPFNLNSAVDALLKKEFDIHRAKGSSHPLMSAYGLNLVPFRHKMMDEWRENFKGVQFLHPATNFLVTGAVDDLWVDAEGKIYIVDYKSTSKDGEVSLDADWQIGYKRQMEIYQWLMRRNGFSVSDTGYFVYCNGRADKEAFDSKLEFDIKLIPYVGDDSWVDSALVSAKLCLDGSLSPASSDCDFCNYREAAAEAVSKKKNGRLFD
jgi:hypothetical protein